MPQNNPYQAPEAAQALPARPVVAARPEDESALAELGRVAIYALIFGSLLFLTAFVISHRALAGLQRLFGASPLPPGFPPQLASAGISFLIAARAARSAVQVEYQRLACMKHESCTPPQCVSAQRASRSNSLAQRARNTGHTHEQKAQRADHSIRTRSIAK